MPERFYYTAKVSQEARLEIFHDIRENEQSIQPFTQLPAAGHAGSSTTEGHGLCAHDLFYEFTARVMMEKKVFTR